MACPIFSADNSYTVIGFHVGQEVVELKGGGNISDKENLVYGFSNKYNQMKDLSVHNL